VDEDLGTFLSDILYMHLPLYSFYLVIRFTSNCADAVQLSCGRITYALSLLPQAGYIAIKITPWTRENGKSRVFYSIPISSTESELFLLWQPVEIRLNPLISKRERGFLEAKPTIRAKNPHMIQAKCAEKY
jgi:hypothetical protein